ncbi:hypothetical protein NEISUBOT_05271 [Neisseria subflava NJ9703]|uniref:Uncharacterized protein n=1 Tax=Neisseria subflava NJ9703 TaxID=546268 RepID=A0A9W5IP74_NEISU|nr:hypothetical protein NEISUBOT_05271 [Neisseria subflava NJ9703]
MDSLWPFDVGPSEKGSIQRFTNQPVCKLIVICYLHDKNI